MNSPARQRGVWPRLEARPEGPAHPLRSHALSAAPSALIFTLSLSRPDGRAYSLAALRASAGSSFQPLDTLLRPGLFYRTLSGSRQDQLIKRKSKPIPIPMPKPIYQLENYPLFSCTRVRQRPVNYCFEENSWRAFEPMESWRSDCATSKAPSARES